MKQLLLLLFVLTSFTACKKETDTVTPTPTALADKFAGTYTLNSFRYMDTESEVNLNLPSLPASDNGQTVSGTVKLVKKTDTTVDMHFLMKITGADDFKLDIADMQIKQVGSEYGLFVRGTRLADVEGSVVIFNYSETDPKTNARFEMAYVAKR